MNLSLLLDRSREAKRLTGKKIVTQIREILRLRKGSGRLGVSEYFDYGLFDDEKNDEKSRQAFVGWNGETNINDHFNKSEWAALSLDKIVFYTFLEGAGIPYPKVDALYSINNRFMRGIETLTSAGSLADYLRTKANYPLFTKPSHGNFGRGSFFLSGYDPQNDHVVFNDGSTEAVSSFTESLETKLSGGYIFQQVFNPPSALVDICGPRSSTVRVVVVIDKEGAKLLSAVWKIPTGNNVIDNFQHGRTGNLVSSVNVQTGEIKRIIGQGADGEFIEVTEHPNTGKPLLPLTLPDWPQIETLCFQSARVLPGIRLLHFDIALSENGPLLLEINYRGNIDLHQHASGKGFLSDQLISAMQDQTAYRQEIKQIIQKTLREQAGSSGA